MKQIAKASGPTSPDPVLPDGAASGPATGQSAGSDRPVFAANERPMEAPRESPRRQAGVPPIGGGPADRRGGSPMGREPARRALQNLT